MYPWGHVSEIQSIKETYVSCSAPSVLSEVGTNQGGDNFHFLHQLGPPLRATGGRVSYYPVLLSWGHCLGSLLETAYSPLPSQTCICLLHNVIHTVWHSVMLDYSLFRHISGFNDSNSSTSSCDNGGTSSSSKGSSSQQHMLTSQCNNESSLQPCFGPKVGASSTSN